MPRSDTLNEFLRVLADDRARGRNRSVGDYQGLFPGLEEEIAREWDVIHGEGPMPLTHPEEPGIELRIGSRVGPYRLREELGRGGQGVVFLAEDDRLRREVALKVLTRFGRLSREGVVRFQREAEMAARLDHPGICTVYDTGEDGGVLYIAMRYVKGTSLVTLLDAARAGVAEGGDRSLPGGTFGAQLSGGDVCGVFRFVEKVARALQAAHDAGVIHRDLKPGNVIVTPAGDPVVLDFGLARDIDTVGLTLTRTDALVGTPAYVAPEQLRDDGHGPDARTDVHALGVLLFECLTLRRPYEGARRETLFVSILEDDPPDPRSLNPHLPRDARTVVEHALAKDPARRYPTAAALAEDLRRLATGEPVLARPVPRWERALRFVRRRPGVAAFLACGVIVVLVLGFLLARWPEIQDARRIAHEQEIQRRLDDAWLALAEGRRPLESFRAILADEASSVEALAGLAICTLETRGPRAALDVLETRPDLADCVGIDILHESLRARLGPVADREQPIVPCQGIESFLVGHVALHHARTGRLTADQAVSHFHRAILQPDPAPPYYYFCLAEALGYHRRPGLANEVADILLRRWPDSLPARYWAARALLLVDPARAEDLLGQVLERDPHHVNARVAMARTVFRDRARRDEAWDWLRKAEALAPRHRRVLREKVRQLQERGRIEEALDVARELTGLPDTNAKDRHRVGALLMMLGRFEEARPLLQEAADRDPYYWNAWSNLGITLSRLGRFQRAMDAMRKAIALEPGAYNARCALGLALTAIRREGEAVRWFQEAIALRPDRDEPVNGLTMALLLAGDVTAAVEVAGSMRDRSVPAARWPARALAIQQALDAGDEPPIADENDRHLLAILLEARGDEAATAAWLRSPRAPTGSPMDYPRVRAALCTLRSPGSRGTDDAARRRRDRCLERLESTLADLRRHAATAQGRVKIGVYRAGLLNEPILDDVRDHPDRAGLDTDEQERWKAFFDAVRATGDEAAGRGQ